MFDTESDKAIVIFEDQKIKFHDAEYKYYVVIQTLDFIEKFLGKESHHYAAVKSFSLPNCFPDTSDSLYDIKLRNAERRFNACIDGIVDTIIKVGLNKDYNYLEDLPAEYPSVQKKNKIMIILTFLWDIISKNPLISAIIAAIISALILKYYYVI